MEVVQADDRHRLVAVAAVDRVEEDAPLAVLRLGDSEQEGERRREVDRLRRHLALRDPLAPGERRPHVDVRGQVLEVRHVPVLAEEVRWRDQRPGVSASYWYGGYENTTRSPVRVGWAMSVVLPGPFGMERASAFVKARSIIFQPSGLPSPVQSLGSVSARYVALIDATVLATSAAATCCKPPPAGSRPATLR